jgi:hypothetical protein
LANTQRRGHCKKVKK